MASDRCYGWADNDLMVNVKVTAGASTDEITGEVIPGTEGSDRSWLRVKVAVPPVKGKANKRVCKLLAAQFGVPRSRVEIIRGETRAYKQVRVIDPVKLPEFISS